MPLFKYKVAGANGKTSEMLIEGDSQPDSLSRLRSRGLIPVECYGQVENYSSQEAGHFWQRSSFDACAFTNRLAPLLKAHVPLERALGIIADGAENSKDRHVVNDLRRGLHEGKKMSALIRDQGKRFPGLYANLLEAGEETGALEDVVSELQRYLNERKELKEFLVTSSIYPVIVLAVTLFVVILLFTVFIPRFAQIFEDMGKALPLPTKIMLEISNLSTGLWWLWILIIAGISWGISRIKKGGKAGRWWDNFILQAPLIGGLIKLIELCRFLRTLAVLVKNHVHLLRTVNISSRIIQNSIIADSLGGIASELRGGSKLSGALKKNKFVPLQVIQML
jgi:general secretion pathway protein F